MIAAAIDIGLTGAVGFVDSRGGATVVDIPTLPDGEKGKRIDGRGLALLLRQHIPAGESFVVVFEDVRPRPMGNGGRAGNTMHSQGSLMRSRGVVEGVLDILRMPGKPVQPQAWKRHFGLIGGDKGDSLDTARRLFPAAHADLKRVKDHNRAEALLIAHYGLKEFA